MSKARLAKLVVGEAEYAMPPLCLTCPRSAGTDFGDVAFPHDNGAGLTVLLDALPTDGRTVLV